MSHRSTLGAATPTACRFATHGDRARSATRRNRDHASRHDRDGRIASPSTPIPSRRTGELLVRVHAAGLNGADMLQLKGATRRRPARRQDIPGLELAGEVVGARRRRAARFEPGDRVMAVVGGGGQAELAVVHERAAMPVPDALDWPAAGGVPEVFTTAHDALFTQAGLRPASGCSSTAPPAASARRPSSSARSAGARVTATVRNEELREQVAALGAPGDRPRGLRRARPVRRDPRARRRAQPGRQPRGARHRRPDRVIGVGAGAKTEINLLALMGKRGRIHGSTLRARPLEEKA